MISALRAARSTLTSTNEYVTDPSSEITRSNGRSVIPSDTSGLGDAAANSTARAATTSSNLEFGTASSTSFHLTARLPLTPSSVEQNTSARSRRTWRLSVTRVSPPVPGSTASNGTSGKDTEDDESSVSMM